MLARSRLRVLRTAFFLVAFAALFSLFRFNFPQVAEPKWFATFQFDSDENVLGRVAMTRWEDFWSRGALLGHYSANDTLLENGQPSLEWKIYTAQIGLQGWVYTLVDALFSPKAEAVFLFWTVASVFSALCLTLLFEWVAVEIGLGAAVAMLLGVFISPWLVVFGKSLYCALWTHFLPLLVVAWGLHFVGRDGFRRVVPWLFGAFFIRAASGHEYFPVDVFAAWTPAVFYAIRERWGWRRFILGTLAIGFTATAAFLLTLAVTVWQTYLGEGGTMVEAIGSVLAHGAQRLSIDIPGFIPPPEDVRGRDCGIGWIIGYYFQGLIDGFYPEPMEGNWQFAQTFGRMTFGVLTLGAVVLSLMPVIFRRCYAKATWLNQISLIGAMGAGFAGMMSWHLIAKQHSYVHYHVSFILFYLPFLFFFFALVGDSAHKFIRALVNYPSQELKPRPRLMCEQPPNER